MFSDLMCVFHHYVCAKVDRVSSLIIFSIHFYSCRIRSHQQLRLDIHLPHMTMYVLFFIFLTD